MVGAYVDDVRRLEAAPEEDPEGDALVPDRVESLRRFLADVRETGVGDGLRVALANRPSSAAITETFRDLPIAPAVLALAVSRLLIASRDLVVATGNIFHSGKMAALPSRLAEAAAAALDAIEPASGSVSPSALASLAQAAADIGQALHEKVGRMVTNLEGADPTSPSNSSLIGAVEIARTQAASLGSRIRDPSIAAAIAGPSSRAVFLLELHSPSNGLDLDQAALQLRTVAKRVRAVPAEVRAVLAMMEPMQTLRRPTNVVCTDEDVVAATWMRNLGLRFVCCEVRKVLVDEIGESELTRLGSFLSALRGGGWQHAAKSLERTSFCSANLSRCETIVARVQVGCSVPDFWAEAPRWPAVMASFNVSGASVLLNGWDGVRWEGKATDAAILKLDSIKLAVSGTLSCLGQQVAAHLPFEQQGANITFRPSPDKSGVTSDVAAATALLMRLDPAGSLVPDAGPDRWWLDHSQHIVNAQLVAALLLDAPGLCSVVGDQDALGSYLLDMLAEHGNQLLSPTPAEPLAAMHSGTVAALLGDQPVVSVFSDGCSIHCVRGVLVGRVASTLQAGSCSLPGHYEADVDLLPLKQRLCFQWHLVDYEACALTKEEADTRFLTCVNSSLQGESPPQEALLQWWANWLPSLSLPAEAQQRLGAAFDCSTFTAAQRRACTCSLFTPAPTKNEIPADSVGCMAGSVHLGNGNHSILEVALPTLSEQYLDVLSLRRRLSELGHTSTPGLPLEHSLRLVQCAAAGESAFEDLCDLFSAPCTVSGAKCPPHRVVTERSSCLRELLCTVGRVDVGSVEHALLRSSSAPEWRELPAQGCGFQVSTAAGFRVWGSSWLVRALVHAGRQLFGSQEGVLMVAAASLPEGGAVAGTDGFQTGLELEVVLTEASHASAHLTALVSAGFTLADANCTSVITSKTCAIGPLNEVWRNPPARVHARLTPPTFVTPAPLVRNASWQLGIGAQTLLVTGSDLGEPGLVILPNRQCTTTLATTGGKDSLSAVCSEMNDTNFVEVRTPAGATRCDAGRFFLDVPRVVGGGQEGRRALNGLHALAGALRQPAASLAATLRTYLIALEAQQENSDMETMVPLLTTATSRFDAFAATATQARLLSAAVLELQSSLRRVGDTDRPDPSAVALCSWVHKTRSTAGAAAPSLYPELDIVEGDLLELNRTVATLLSVHAAISSEGVSHTADQLVSALEATSFDEQAVTLDKTRSAVAAGALELNALLNHVVTFQRVQNDTNVRVENFTSLSTERQQQSESVLSALDDVQQWLGSKTDTVTHIPQPPICLDQMCVNSLTI